MNISDIEAFLAIADTKNLSKAADMLFITQSTISYRLKRLEKELDIELVKRSRGERFIELTPKGVEFIYTAQQWITLWKHTQHFRESTHYINLRIAQVDWFIAYPFDRFYHGLLEDEPQLKLDIRTGHSIPISEMINNVEVDIGFVVHPVISNQILCKPIFRDPLVLVCSGRAGRTGKKIHPKNLDAHHEIFWKYYGDLRIWHEQWWDPTVIPTIQIDFSVPLSFKLLSNPELWLVSPRSIAEKQVMQNPDLKIYEFSAPPPDIVCYCIQRNMPSQQAIPSIEILLRYLEHHNDTFIQAPYMQI